MRTPTRPAGPILRIGAKPIEDDVPSRVHVMGPPRCGNHWMHYILEHLVAPDKATWGHMIYNPVQFQMLFLILRNPKESIIRHSTGPDNQKIPEEWLMDRINTASENVYESNVNNYFNPIYYYEECEAPKHLIYYEDLITNPEDEIRRIASLLRVSPNNFLSDYENHRQKSLDQYNVGMPRTQGKKIIHHSLRISQSSREKADEYFCDRHPTLVKYIQRYLERTQLCLST